MQQRMSPSNDHSPGHRLNHLFGEINAFLVAVAIGLAVLDFTCFVALNASAEMARAHQSTSAGTPSPAFSEFNAFR